MQEKDQSSHTRNRPFQTVKDKGRLNIVVQTALFYANK